MNFLRRIALQEKKTSSDYDWTVEDVEYICNSNITLVDWACYDGVRAGVTVALRGTRWRHRLSLQTPQHNETIDVFYIKILMTARFSMLLKSRASLTCFRACFLPGRAKDLSAPGIVMRYVDWLLPSSHSTQRMTIPVAVNTELVDAPADEQQACSKHVNAYKWNTCKLMKNSASCWFILYGQISNF